MAVVKRKGWPYRCRESAECVAGIYRAMLEAAPARGIEADARRAGAESPVPSGTRPEGMAAAQGEALTDERIDEVAAKWSKEAPWYDFERNDFRACVREIAALAQGEAPPPSVPAGGSPTRYVPVEWEYRLRIRGQGDPWSEWHRCTQEVAEGYARSNHFQWEYQTRTLFAAAPHPEQAQSTIRTEHGPWLASMHEGETYCQRCKVRSIFASQRKCDPHVATEQAQPAVPALTVERIELVAAWNDLPDSLRCHPGLKRLFRACQAIPSATPPAQVEQPDCRVVDIGFRWDGKQHIPKLVIEFTPVPMNSPNDAKGWKDRDALAAALTRKDSHD
jgi:hypothetical protein